jgi:5'-nucleotidase
MKKKIIYIDLDGPTVDFESGIAQLHSATKAEYAGRLDEVPGIFGLMQPTVGAIEAITVLAEHFDVYFLSTAPWENPSAWSDKVLFVQRHFPVIGHKRLILSHNKHLNRGDYLIDDRPNNGAAEFQGEWIKYGHAYYQNHPDKQSYTWATILDYLVPLADGEPHLSAAGSLAGTR